MRQWSFKGVSTPAITLFFVVTFSYTFCISFSIASLYYIIHHSYGPRNIQIFSEETICLGRLSIPFAHATPVATAPLERFKIGDCLHVHINVHMYILSDWVFVWKSHLHNMCHSPGCTWSFWKEESHLFLSRMLSIAAHRNHFVRRRPVRLSVW